MNMMKITTKLLKKFIKEEKVFPLMTMVQFLQIQISIQQLMYINMINIITLLKRNILTITAQIVNKKQIIIHSKTLTTIRIT